MAVVSIMTCEVALIGHYMKTLYTDPLAEEIF